MLATELLQIIYFSQHPTSNVIEMNQYQLLYPTVELENLGMGKDYVSLTYIKSKSK